MPPLVKDWQKDLVYLIQFPRAGSIPTISPYSLKLETWMRIASIPYKNVDNQFKHKSTRGQVPFIEINGRQIADTNHIIDELTRMFHVQIDSNLTPQEEADMVAYHSLIENSIFWDYFYFRGKDNAWFATRDGIIGHFSGIKKFVFKNFILGRMKKSFTNTAVAQGIGRGTPGEIVEMAKKQLKALSVFLGRKKYLMGGSPTTLDATAFGHLCQIYFTPTNKELHNYMDEETRNLVDYLRDLRDEFWPDWHEATTTLSLQTQPKNLAATKITD